MNFANWGGAFWPFLPSGTNTRRRVPWCFPEKWRICRERGRIMGTYGWEILNFLRLNPEMVLRYMEPPLGSSKGIRLFRAFLNNRSSSHGNYDRPRSTLPTNQPTNWVSERAISEYWRVLRKRNINALKARWDSIWAMETRGSGNSLNDRGLGPHVCVRCSRLTFLSQCVVFSTRRSQKEEVWLWQSSLVNISYQFWTDYIWEVCYLFRGDKTHVLGIVFLTLDARGAEYTNELFWPSFF